MKNMAHSTMSICFALLAAGCSANGPEPQWRAAMTNQVQWVEIRPIIVGFNGVTFSKCVIISNSATVRQLAAEMTGSPYTDAWRKDTLCHWACLKWVQLDFHFVTNTIGFVVGVHYKYPIALSQEICHYWEGWHRCQEGARSGALPALLDGIALSNNVAWVSADKWTLGATHYAVLASKYPPGDPRVDP